MVAKKKKVSKPKKATKAKKDYPVVEEAVKIVDPNCHPGTQAK